MASIVVGTTDPRPAHEPDGVCARCGQHGTYARVTRETEPPVDHRYCRRCWSAAHRRHIAERGEEVARWFSYASIGSASSPFSWRASLSSSWAVVAEQAS